MTDDDTGLLVEEQGRVVRVTLNRPDRLNVLDDTLRKAFADLLHQLEDRPDLSVLVLSGAGRAFSAGADFRNTAYPPIEGDWATRRHRTGTWQRVLEQLDRVPQATVARLHGHVVGGAALLASAFDIRVAADDTVLRIPELAIGIPLTWAGMAPRSTSSAKEAGIIIGINRTRTTMLSSEPRVRVSWTAAEKRVPTLEIPRLPSNRTAPSRPQPPTTGRWKDTRTSGTKMASNTVSMMTLTISFAR